MDFEVADRRRRRRTRRLLIAGGSAAGVAAIFVLLGNLSPGAPEVARSALWTGVVERGELVRQVRGPGALQVPPEEIRWLAAQTRGRIEERRVLPGTPVEADTVLLVISNPEIEQEARDAELQLRAQRAELRRLAEQTRADLLEQENAATELEAASSRARRRADADARLLEAGLIGELNQRRSLVTADELETRYALETERLQTLADSSAAQFASKEATVASFRAVFELRRRQLAALTVRAGRRGILLEIPVEAGEEVTVGANLARVANPQELKAVLRVPETQARDVTPGQRALVDTRNGVVPGVVARVDPAVREGTVAVDIRLEGDLPRGARPDLSVEGTIDIERIPDALHVARPAYGQPDSTVGLFRIAGDGRTAVRIPVELGRGSVNRIEVRAGLAEGEEVILSDTSSWDAWDTIRLR